MLTRWQIFTRFRRATLCNPLVCLLMSHYNLLSVAEVAERINRNRWFIYDEINRKRIAFYRIGGRIAISQRDLDDYVARARVAALGEKKTKIKPVEAGRA
jgi:excisionase family DNA binding protein